MKKMKGLTLFLCLCLAMQMVAIPSAATESTDPTQSNQVTMPAQSVVSSQTAAQVPFGMACIQNGCRTIEGMMPLAGSDRKLASAQGAFLFETNTETVVYSYNPDEQISPGSLTKLVTAAVTLQNCALEDVVIVTGDVHRRPSGSIHAGLKTDEELTVKDLLHFLLLESANDAAIALAIHVAGSRESFVTLMNQWARSAGCVATEFGSVHGLDDNSKTTARDMTKILIAATQDETLKEILGTLYYEMPATNKNEARSFRTINYMIDKGTIEDFYDDRVTGGVTSYVQSYGASLAVTMESNDMHFVGVVLGCTRTFNPDVSWKPIIYGNFNEMTDLLKLAFNNYKINRIIYEGMTLDQFTVAGGECDAVGQAMVNVDSVVPINANMNNLYMNFSITDGGLTAPVEQGELIATMQIRYLDSVMAEAEVYAMGDVSVAEDNGVTVHSTQIQGAATSGILSAIGTICVIVLGLVAAYLALNAYMRSRMRARRRKRRADRRRNY